LSITADERDKIKGIMDDIVEECAHSTDTYTHEVIISYLELMLNVVNRCYARQAALNKTASHELLIQVEKKLGDYFKDTSQLPTVKLLAEQLNISPGYLSDTLRKLTGQNAQQHIQHMLIEKAKVLLSTTNLSTSEIAYQLGFGHSQSFARLFKQKVKVSPGAYRERFE
jgi:AraC family transcriptional regulator, transcriptional activator of pobA